MNLHVLKRDFAFFSALFVVWSAGLIIWNSHYKYYSLPLVSVSKEDKIDNTFYKRKVIDRSIRELHESLTEESRLFERGHIQHNIGTAYFDLYKISGKQSNLDSSRVYYQYSIKSVNTVPRFMYNLGRVYTEYQNHTEAKKYYEKAIELKPDHILALHNLALMHYFSFGHRDTAQMLLEKALNYQPDLLMCNYVLGLIFEDSKDYQRARDSYNKEIGNYHNYFKTRPNLPASAYSIRLAATGAHRQLAVYYTKQEKNKEKAEMHLQEFLGLERDKRLREELINIVRK